MSNKPTIIILCGGRGERLRPLTNTIPKPLIRIKGKPIIGHLVDYLISEKFNKFIFATGYKSKEIKKYIIKKYNKFDISFVNNKEASIIERIQNCITKLNESTIICYADTIANIDFKKYLSIIDKNKPDTLMTIYQPESKFGVVHCGKKKLIKYFEEKPLLSHWINIGYFYLNKNQFKSIDKFKDFVFFIKNKIKKKKLLYFQHKKLHITVNSVTELVEAKKNIHHFKQ
jgi:glucose-1-phosphate cytidylyltransferase